MALAPSPLTSLSEAQRAQALERFMIIRPALEKEILDKKTQAVGIFLQIINPDFVAALEQIADKPAADAPVTTGQEHTHRPFLRLRISLFGHRRRCSTVTDRLRAAFGRLGR